MATNPTLLLLDEPAAGMNSNETSELMDIIRFIRDEFNISVLLIEHDMRFVSGLCDEITVLNFGTTIFLVEQNANKALDVCDRAYVLENGKIVLSGTGKELAQSDSVKKAYLGGFCGF